LAEMNQQRPSLYRRQFPFTRIQQVFQQEAALLDDRTVSGAERYRYRPKPQFWLVAAANCYCDSLDCAHINNFHQVSIVERGGGGVLVDQQNVTHLHWQVGVAPELMADAAVVVQRRRIGWHHRDARLFVSKAIKDPTNSTCGIRLLQIRSTGTQRKLVEPAGGDGVTQPGRAIKNRAALALPHHRREIEHTCAQTELVLEVFLRQGWRSVLADRWKLNRIAHEEQLGKLVVDAPRALRTRERHQIGEEPTGTEPDNILSRLPVAHHRRLVDDVQRHRWFVLPQRKDHPQARVIGSFRLLVDLNLLEAVNLRVKRSTRAIRSPCHSLKLVAKDARRAAGRRQCRARDPQRDQRFNQI